MFYAVEAYTSRQWNIRETIHRWFWNVKPFLKLLDAHNGIVSGSEAVQFFARRKWPCTDMNIYVPLHGLLPIGRYIQRQDFFFTPSNDKHPFFDAAALSYTSYMSSPDSPLHRRSTHPGPHAYTAFGFARPPNFSAARPGRRIQIIVVHGNPVEYIINNFHSSTSTKLACGRFANVFLLQPA